MSASASNARHKKLLSGYLASNKTSKKDGDVNRDNGSQPSAVDLTEMMKGTHLGRTNQSHPQKQPSNRSSLSTATGSSKSRGTEAPRGRKIPGVLKRRATIYDLPEEVLFQLMSYLPASSLINCSCVCKKWHHLANDNTLWRSLYCSYATSKIDLVGHRLKPLDTESHDKTWKRKCIRKCIEKRDARIPTMLKKSNPYTHLPDRSDKSIQLLGITWELVLKDSNKSSFTFASSDSFSFPMSHTVRFYHLEFPPIKTLKSLSIIAKAPIFFKGSKVADNSPCQSSLLIQHDLCWKNLSTSHPPDAYDDLVDLRVIGHCVLVATWKDGGELAFISVCLHNHGLIQRCTQGSQERICSLPSCRPKPDDIDPNHGLHDFTCIVELRNQRSNFWGQQFKNVHCCEQNREGRFVRLIPVRPDVMSDHSFTSKKLQLPWKSDLFKGIVQDFCILDVTLHDEFLQPFWCISCPVAVKEAQETIGKYWHFHF
ncbi:F-box only protein 15-like [Asterias rubens]|uniref:F-box only protein 15-like n=1 Tax=Asterias rubens TaxID=7604 RepID=UPI0014553A28|nr:F-box only protein 15-like [Asterias rubens]